MNLKAESERVERLLSIYDEPRLIEWGGDYILGLDEIDNQHKLIVQYINLLHLMINKETVEFSIESVFKSLHNYAVVHFEFEEKMFAEKDYEFTTEHKIEHKLFTSQIEDYFHKFKAGEKDIVVQVFEYLKKWLLNHILIDDKKYVDGLHLKA